MNKVLSFQEGLAKKYNYQPLEPSKSKISRELYRLTIPSFLNQKGDKKKLYNKSGTLICDGYERIVIGDYGAFIEFTLDQANGARFLIKPGEEYRLLEKYKNIKYWWYTTNDASGIKIYYQKQTVTYADYKPDFFYVSVFEVYEGE